MRLFLLLHENIESIPITYSGSVYQKQTPPSLEKTYLERVQQEKISNKKIRQSSQFIIFQNKS